MIRRYQPFETIQFPKIAQNSVASSALQITTASSLWISALKPPIYAAFCKETRSLLGTPPNRPSSTSLNWSISELVCLAIVEGTCSYHTYLAGCLLSIVTDHVSLTFFKSLKAARGHLQRWALHLQGYTPTVCYKAGKTLTSADGLSRQEYPTPAPEPETGNKVLDDSDFLANIDVDIFDKQSANMCRLPKTREHYSINFEYNVSDTADSHHDDILLADTPVLIAPLSDRHDVPGAQRQCPDFTNMKTT